MAGQQLRVDDVTQGPNSNPVIGALTDGKTFETFRRSLQKSDNPKWVSLSEETRWTHLSQALKTSGYGNEDFQEFLRDVSILEPDFLAAVPMTETPRARAALSELLEVIDEHKNTGDLNMRVETQMTVERIFDMNTLTQTFGVQLFVEMYWPLPSWETRPRPREDDGDWEPSWSPKFRVRNLVEEMVVTRMFTVVQRENKDWVVSRQRHLVRLYELMNLRSFPVDCQTLHIRIQSMLPTEAVKWEPTTQNGKRCPEARLDASRCLFNDFYLIDEIPFTSYMSIDENTDPTRHLSYIVMKVNISRNLFFYFVNVAVVIFLISSFSLCAWGVHPAEIQGRLDTDFTVILTAVAFKLVLSSMLPSVSYVTRLDVYVLCCLLMVTAVTLIHTSLPHCFYTFLEMSALTISPDSIGGEQDLIDADLYVLYVFAVIWALFNIIFWTSIKVLSAKELKRFCTDAIKEQTTNTQKGRSMQDCSKVSVIGGGSANPAALKGGSKSGASGPVPPEHSKNQVVPAPFCA